MVVNNHVGAGNPSQVFCKSNKWSKPLIQFSSPYVSFFLKDELIIIHFQILIGIILFLMESYFP